MAQEQHNRLNEKLRDYWLSLLKNRSYPLESDVDPDRIADIWDSCFLVKNLIRQTDHQGFRYDYLGKSLIDAFGDDVTNKEISAKLVDLSSLPLVKSFSKVCDLGKPVEEEGEFTNSQGLIIKYRSCMLPLGVAGKGVDYILGGMKWKSF